MNPWGDVPKPKRYPLGEIQRILSESSAFDSYNKKTSFGKKLTLNEDEETEFQKVDIVSEAYELLKMNNEILDLRYDFEAIDLYSKYNHFVSETALQEKIKIISNLLNVVKSAMDINLGESGIQRDSSMSTSGNNFITIDYQNKTALIETLKFIKQHESKLDQGDPLCIREDMDVQDLITYFYTKDKKLDVLFDKLTEIHNKLVSQHEQIENLRKH